MKQVIRAEARRSLPSNSKESVTVTQEHIAFGLYVIVQKLVWLSKRLQTVPFEILMPLLSRKTGAPKRSRL
jgi:hypothetical protein